MFTFFSTSSKTKPVAETPLSRFVHKASSAEKKRIYNTVIRQASEEQRAILTTYRERRSAPDGAVV